MGAIVSRSLTWVDRQGEEEPLRVPRGQFTGPALSPDGSLVALVSFDGQSYKLWVYETATGRGLRLTDGGGHVACNRYGPTTGSRSSLPRPMACRGPSPALVTSPPSPLMEAVRHKN